MMALSWRLVAVSVVLVGVARAMALVSLALLEVVPEAGALHQFLLGLLGGAIVLPPVYGMVRGPGLRAAAAASAGAMLSAVYTWAIMGRTFHDRELALLVASQATLWFCSLLVAVLVGTLISARWYAGEANHRQGPG